MASFIVKKAAESLVLSSHAHFTKAIQAEVWEDVEQADIHYTEFIKEYRVECLQLQSRNELQRCIKVILLVELRIQDLNDVTGSSSTVEVKDLKRVRSNITRLHGFSDDIVGKDDQKLFPPSLFEDHQDRLKSLYAELCAGVVEAEALTKQEEKALKISRGLSITIERVGEKNYDKLLRPFVRVYLYDHDGKNEIERSIDTKGGNLDKWVANHIIFMEDIRFNTEIQTCKDQNYVVFFELISRDKRKGIDVTKCWACLEMDEIPIGGGPLLLEWYTPPINFQRKKLTLHTMKELYCNIIVNNEE